VDIFALATEDADYMTTGANTVVTTGSALSNIPDPAVVSHTLLSGQLLISAEFDRAGEPYISNTLEVRVDTIAPIAPILNTPSTATVTTGGVTVEVVNFSWTGAYDLETEISYYTIELYA
jgi:hypothetical protein